MRISSENWNKLHDLVGNTFSTFRLTVFCEDTEWPVVETGVQSKLDSIDNQYIRITNCGLCEIRVPTDSVISVGTEDGLNIAMEVDSMELADEIVTDLQEYVCIW